MRGARRRLVVDADACVMAGECIYNHPDHFAWNDDGSAATPIRAEIVGPDDERHAQQAISLCPGGAISIVTS